MSNQEKENALFEAIATRSIEKAAKTGGAKWAAAYRHHKPEPAKKLATAATVLEVVTHLYEVGVCGVLVRQKIIASILKQKNLPYLPKNGRIIARKIKAIANGAKMETLVKMPRQGNQNARKPPKPPNLENEAKKNRSKRRRQT